MNSNVIAFTARPANDNRSRLAQTMTEAADNVVALTAWIGRAIPHRTPNGVFFTTRMPMAGDFA